LSPSERRIAAKAVGHREQPPVVNDVAQAHDLAHPSTDRAVTLRQAMHCCRKGGTVSVPGVYGGFVDKMPIGAAFGKGLTLKMGQTHVHKYLPRLLRHIENGDIDPSFVVTHRVPLDKAPDMYTTFRDKQDGCVKVVMKPH
jgi:threonine dehydrogenase-like Zn-dependent dehydrogenase